jgi:hypothetical protein
MDIEVITEEKKDTKGRMSLAISKYAEKKLPKLKHKRFIIDGRKMTVQDRLREVLEELIQIDEEQSA